MNETLAEDFKAHFQVLAEDHGFADYLIARTDHGDFHAQTE